jgi:hypothetical protein
MEQIDSVHFIFIIMRFVFKVYRKYSIYKPVTLINTRLMLCAIWSFPCGMEISVRCDEPCVRLIEVCGVLRFSVRSVICLDQCGVVSVMFSSVRCGQWYVRFSAVWLVISYVQYVVVSYIFSSLQCGQCYV